MKTPPQVDQLDRDLADRLVVDGRESNRSLAAALGVTEHTVAARLRRMEAERIMRVVAMTDVSAFGHAYYVFAMIEVANRSPLDVAGDLADIPELISVNVTSGRYSVIARLMAGDRKALARLVGEAIASTPGVQRVSCEWVVETVYFAAKYAVLTDAAPHVADVPLADGLDQVDVRLIHHLQHDARTSNRKIAELLDISEGTVRSRIRRLETERFIRIQAVCDFRAFGLHAGAFVGITAAGGQVDLVGRQLVGLEGVQFALRTIGEFDFQLVVFRDTPESLASTLYETIARIPGVAAIEAQHLHSATKHVYTWSYIR
jgi:DNA-binding Lrp family transcriptional regulator